MQDSGRTPPAAEAANPNSGKEHVRNNAVAMQGGTSGALRMLWEVRICGQGKEGSIVGMGSCLNVLVCPPPRLQPIK